MLLQSKNIVSSFLIRALFAMVFISLLSSVSIYFFQKYSFYTSLADEIQEHVDRGLQKHHNNLKLASEKRIKEDVQRLMMELGFVSVELYDNTKSEIYSFTQEGNWYGDKLEMIKQHDAFIVHDFPQSKKMRYNFIELPNKEYFLQVFYPIYKSDKLLGYIEGISYVEPRVVNRFKRGIFVTIIIVILTVVIFSLLIFPLIYFAYTKLNRNRLELLSSNIMAINTLGNAIALRDSDTNEHNYRVTLYAIWLAQELGLKRDEIKKLIIGAFLHDVGKIGISDTILLKGGKLDENEFEVMQEHVLKGVELIKGNSWLEASKDIILYHHERYDGKGYPNGLSAEQIPLSARIFSVVDVFDALSSKRPYKEAYDYARSIEILKKERGSHFDAEVLDRFLGISNRLYLDITLKSKELLKEELDSLIKAYFLD